MTCTNCDTENVTESPDPSMSCCSAAWARFQDAKALGTMFSRLDNHDWQVTRSMWAAHGCEYGFLLKVHGHRWLITGRGDYPGVYTRKRDAIAIVEQHMSREALRRSLAARGEL